MLSDRVDDPSSNLLDGGGRFSEQTICTWAAVTGVLSILECAVRKVAHEAEAFDSYLEKWHITCTAQKWCY